MTKIYTDRSNAKRAARREVGSGRIEVYAVEGGFSWRELGAEDAPTATTVDAHELIFGAATPEADARITEPSKPKRPRAVATPAASAVVAAEPTPAPSKPKAEKPLGQRAAALAAAQSGKIPCPPDFSAPSHKPYRKMLASVIALVEAKDIAGLKAFPINPASSSRKAVDKYRLHAIMALEAQAAA